MGRLIAVVGPSGVGKTSLVRAPARSSRFALGLEQHTRRPFQQLFNQDKSYALPNQVDYLLHRAEQERELRAQALPALMDGGLDQDFHAFTRLFHARGWLGDSQYALCGRLYAFTRGLLPPPDLVVALDASPDVIIARLAGRERVNIAAAADTQLLQTFLDEWLASLPPQTVLRLDVTTEQLDYTQSAQVVMRALSDLD